MEAPAPAPWPALGVLLIRDGLVTRTELEAALAAQNDGRERRVSGQRLGEALVDSGVVTSAQVARLVAEQHELPFVDLDESDSIGPVATRLPEDLARRCSALPIRLFPDGSLLVTVADPGRLACLDDIRRALGVRVRWAVSAPDSIAAAIDVAMEKRLRQEEDEVERHTVETVARDPALEPQPPGATVGLNGPHVAADSEPRRVFGSLLLRDGLVTEDELDAALAQQRLSSTRRLGEILVARGALSEALVSRALAEQHELPFIDLRQHEIDPTARSLLAADVARRHAALPISYLPDGSVLLVVADPTSALQDDELRAKLGVAVQYAVAPLAEIEAAIGSGSEVDDPPAKIEMADVESIVEEKAPFVASAEWPPFALVPPEDTGEESEDENSETEVMRDEGDEAAAALATIRHALFLGASAIHFMPQGTGTVVCARIDGALSELASFADADTVRNELGRLVAMDLDGTTSPRQGRVLVTSEERTIALRAAVLPTILGTRVTFQVVDDATFRPTLSDLVTDAAQCETIRSALAERRGLLVICGPRGSGRTTTLYAALRELDPSAQNVLTVEDTVEDQIEGIGQTETDIGLGVTPANGLRAILRSDPDVVAVDELVVDDNTARVAVRAALGTLVLATLAAPTASAAIQRLTQSDVAPDSLSAVLTCVVAQQRVRKTCLSCRETYYATVDELVELGLPPEELGRRLLGRGRGCDECGGSGYQRHTYLFEILAPTDDVRALVADRAPAAETERAAVAAGMQTLRENGVRLCLEGVITSVELRRALRDQA